MTTWTIPDPPADDVKVLYTRAGQECPRNGPHWLKAGFVLPFGLLLAQYGPLTDEPPADRTEGEKP